MRIAVVNWTTRRVGGVESYLDTVLPALASQGHDIAVVTESDAPADRPRIRWPADAPVFIASERGRNAVTASLRDWRPDVIFVNNVNDAVLESALQQIAPAVFFAHAYYGTCVSGQKMHAFPRPVPCGRRLGLPCLALYYPRRCGGLNPVTMLRSYQEQRARMQRLDGYARIVTGSAHMRDEYRQHVSRPDSVGVLPMPAVPDDVSTGLPPIADFETVAELRLLFVGRMDQPKGGRMLAAAMPLAARQLGRALDLRAVGDGPDRPHFEAAARAASGAAVRASFPGWLNPAAVREEIAQAHLLVVPSLWPEPFGLVGPEAAALGVPAAAFDVGGIGEWLHEGVNGHLAPGRRPEPEGLADAIARCLQSGAHYAMLRDGAVTAARAFTTARHVEALLALLAEVVRGPQPASGRGMELPHGPPP